MSFHEVLLTVFLFQSMKTTSLPANVWKVSKRNMIHTRVRLFVCVRSELSRVNMTFNATIASNWIIDDETDARIQLNGSEIQLNCPSVCVCVSESVGHWLYIWSLLTVFARFITWLWWLLLILLIIYQFKANLYCSDEGNEISMQRTPNHTKHNQHLQGKVRVSC